MSKKKVGVIVGAVAVAALAAAGIWYFYGDGGRDSNDRVYVERVSSIMGNTMGAQNRFSGVVQPQETVEVNADPERTVKEVLVEIGDAVMEGTPLFNYDTEDLNLELEQAKLELQNQDIEISNYRKQIQDLEKERTAAAEGDKFEYTTQIQTIETQIKQAEFSKSSKQLEMDKIQKKVDNSQVVSKSSGVVKSINNGQTQNEESSAFITILSTGEYRIKGTANEQNVNMISSGLNVIVRSRVDESITWEGVIESLDTERPSNSSDENMVMDSDDGMSSGSSNYTFDVTLADAEGLMLGQHVLIELDEGQMEQKEGIWLFSGYIVFEDSEGAAGEQLDGSTESQDFLDEDGLYYDSENFDEDFMDGEAEIEPLSYAGDMEDVDAADSYDGDESVILSEFGDGGEMLFDMDGSTENPFGEGGQTAFVWADNGNGKLEKRAVELGEYDMELDQYEILSGLTEEDLIAFPMEGLYEGVRTVTNMEEVDYSSGLYNQELGTEGSWEDSDFEGDYDDGNYDGEIYDENYDGEIYDENYDGEIYDENYDGENYDDENYDGDDGNSGEGDGDGLIDRDKDEPIDLDEFLHAGGVQ